MFLMRADPLRGQVGGGWSLGKSRVFWVMWYGIEPIGECHLVVLCTRAHGWL